MDHRRVRLSRVTVAVADDQPTFWDRVEAGRWEPGTLAVYDAEVGPGTLVLDLGAWVGPLALYGAALGARVVAVEADAAALDQLGRNLAANPGIAGRVEVVPRAVAAGTEPVRLGSRRKPGDSMSSVLLGDRDGSWLAETVAPQALAARARPGESLFVKLDIEGGEYGLLPALATALPQGSRLLLSLHPGFLAETGEADPAGRALAALAGFAGWHTSRVDASGPVAAPLSREGLASAETWLLRRDG